MKPIDYIATNPSIEDMQSKALLFSAALYNAMQAKQGNIDTNHLVAPVLLTDGRYGSCCDILSETGEGHIFHELFSVLDMGMSQRSLPSLFFSRITSPLPEGVGLVTFSPLNHRFFSEMEGLGPERLVQLSLPFTPKLLPVKPQFSNPV